MKIKLLLLFFCITFSAVVSAQSLEQQDFKAYTQDFTFTISPNPASNELNIILKTKEEASIEVYNLLGKNIYSGKLATMQYSIDISNWKSGIYLVKVITDDKSITKRFVKK